MSIEPRSPAPPDNTRFAWVCVISMAAELSVYGLLGWSLLDLSRAPLVGVGIYLTVRFLGVVSTFVIAALFGSSRPQMSRCAAFTWPVMVAREFGVLLSLAVAILPLERWLRPKHDIVEGDSLPTPILFIHGYACNAGYWRPTMRYLARHGVQGMYTINLAPTFSPIEVYSSQVSAYIARLAERSSTGKIAVVAHSMGGLVARLSLVEPAVANKVSKLITIASPHHGTLFGWFSMTPDACQMRPSSAFLRTLNGDSALPRVPTTSIFSYDDNVIIPQLSSEIDGVRVIALSGIGHLSMSFTQRVNELILGELAPITTRV